jgi:hypothetical protein
MKASLYFKLFPDSSIANHFLISLQVILITIFTVLIDLYLDLGEDFLIQRGLNFFLTHFISLQFYYFWYCLEFFIILCLEKTNLYFIHIYPTLLDIFNGLWLTFLILFSLNFRQKINLKDFLFYLKISLNFINL